jgi:hypothetical protein
MASLLKVMALRVRTRPEFDRLGVWTQATGVGNSTPRAYNGVAMWMTRGERVVRLTCGLAVLLLAATQEKVCPWLEEVPDQAKSAAVHPAQPASSDDSESREVPPPSLASTLPDVVAPRWPARTLASPPRQPLRGKFARSTVSGRRDYEGTDTVVLDLDAARGFGCRVPPASSVAIGSVLEGGQVLRAYQASFLTSISPTGPPVA